MAYVSAPPAYPIDNGAGGGAGGGPIDGGLSLAQLYAMYPQLQSGYGLNTRIPQVDYQGGTRTVAPAYAALDNRVPTLDSQGQLQSTAAPAAAMNSIGSLFGGSGSGGGGGALQSIGKFLGLGGGQTDPAGNYTPQQLALQSLAQKASKGAYEGISRGVTPSGGVVFDRQENRLPAPMRVLGAQVGARPDLYSDQNTMLNMGGIGAAQAITGQLQDRFARPAAQGIQAAQVAAGQIPGAGADSRAGQAAALGAGFGQARQSIGDLGMVRQSALGQGPSAAENLARSQLDASVRAQAAQAAAARGGNVAAAGRAAADAATQTRLQSTAQLAAQRAQEQLNAQQLLTQGNSLVGNQLGNLAAGAGNMRGQDIGQAVATSSALNDSAKTGTALAGLQSQLAAQGIQGLIQGGQIAGQQDLNAQQFEAQNSNNYANWLQNQFQIAMGIPTQLNAATTQQQIAAQQAAATREGAYANAGAGLIAGLLM